MKAPSNHTKLLLVYLLCFLCGAMVFGAWVSGSHGHLMLRANYIEDWVAALLLFLFWILPIFFLIRIIIKIFF
jgi:hypothetical protein